MHCCHHCGNPWESAKKQPAVKEICESCGAYLHCCLNCRFHAPGRHNECEIPNTEWVGDRRGCNFCDEFEFRQHREDRGGGEKREKARDALDKLLGGVEDGAGKPESFDDLFRE